jgi:hypothetical protein
MYVIVLQEVKWRYIQKYTINLEVKCGCMVAIAQPVQQQPMCLTARVRFPGISSFSWVLFFYVLLTSLCITVMHSVFCTTYVLLFTYYLLFM